MLAVRNCGRLIRGIGENRCPGRAATATPVPPCHKRPKFPEQRGHPHGHTANKHCPAYRENGDLFPSCGDKTLPIPLQRVVKQRVSGCCCGEPADTALGQRRPGSKSVSIAAGVPGGRRASVTSAFTGDCEAADSGTAHSVRAPTKGRDKDAPKTLMPGLDTTFTGITNATAGVSPSTSFLPPVSHPRTDKPNLSEGCRVLRALRHKSPVPPATSK